MTPCFAGFNAFYGSPLHLVIACNQINAARIVSYFSYLFEGEFSALKVIAKVIASLVDHVRVIICGSAQKEVFGINTEAVIATVKNMLTLRDFSFVQYPCAAMCITLFARTLEPSVAVTGTCSNPVPAGFGFRRFNVESSLFLFHFFALTSGRGKR